MKTKEVTLSVRIDDDLKRDFARLCKKLRIPMSTAINMMIGKMVDENGFPYDVKIKDPTLELESLRLEALENEPMEVDEFLKHLKEDV